MAAVASDGDGDETDEGGPFQSTGGPEGGEQQASAKPRLIGAASSRAVAGALDLGGIGGIGGGKDKPGGGGSEGGGKGAAVSLTPLAPLAPLAPVGAPVGAGSEGEAARAQPPTPAVSAPAPAPAPAAVPPARLAITPVALAAAGVRTADLKPPPARVAPGPALDPSAARPPPRAATSAMSAVAPPAPADTSVPATIVSSLAGRTSTETKHGPPVAVVPLTAPVVHSAPTPPELEPKPKPRPGSHPGPSTGQEVAHDVGTHPPTAGDGAAKGSKGPGVRADALSPRPAPEGAPATTVDAALARLEPAISSGSPKPAPSGGVPRAAGAARPTVSLSTLSTTQTQARPAAFGTAERASGPAGAAGPSLAAQTAAAARSGFEPGKSAMAASRGRGGAAGATGEAGAGGGMGLDLSSFESITLGGPGGGPQGRAKVALPMDPTLGPVGIQDGINPGWRSAAPARRPQRDVGNEGGDGAEMSEGRGVSLDEEDEAGGGGVEYVESNDFGGVLEYVPEVLRKEREHETLLQRQAEAAAEGESLTAQFSNRNILLGVAFTMLVVAYIWFSVVTSKPVV